MAWNLTGTYFESCSCDAICPCTWSGLSARATNDRCNFLLAFKIDRGERMNRSISTCCVVDGLVFAPDFSGFLHCLDAQTGQVYWTYDMESAMWGSPLWADGKVFVTDEDGDIRIFADDKQMKKLSPEDDHLNLGSASYCSPVYVNGILYLSSRDTLYAIKTGAQSKPSSGERQAQATEK